MVTITNYTKRKKEDGTTFCVLEVSSGIELIQSQTTGQYYATAKKCYIPATFDESVCRSLRGTMMKGSIVKVECDPYEYTIKESGEIININYKYSYCPEEDLHSSSLSSEESFSSHENYATSIQ